MFTLLRFSLVLLLGSLQIIAQEEPRMDEFMEVSPPPAPSGSKREYRSRSEIFSVGRDVVVPAGDRLHSVVVIGGNLDLQGEAGEVVVVAGDLHLDGKVRRETVVVLGGMQLGSNAVVGGEAFVLGRELMAQPGSQVYRTRQLALQRYLPVTKATEWLKDGAMWGRPLPHQHLWAWVIGLICLAVYVLAAAIAPKAVTQSALALVSRPVSSLIAGIFALLLFLPIMGLLIASIFGIVAAPFLACAFVAAIIIGKAAVCRTIGSRLVGSAGETTHVVLLVALGALLLLLSYFVPVLGFLVWGLAFTMALGAALIAAFSRRYPRKTAPAAPVNLPAAMAQVPVSGATEEAGNVGLGGAFTSSTPSGMALVGAERVGFWMRLAATALDALIFAGIATVLHLKDWLPVLWFAYHVALWAWKGTTIGGIVLGLQVVRIDGRPMDFSTSLIRALSALLSAAVFFLGFFWAGWDSDRQSWHDKIAGTTMVKATRGVALV